MGLAWVALGYWYTTWFDPNGMDFIDMDRQITEHRMNYLPLLVGIPVIVFGLVWVGVGVVRMRRRDRAED